MFQPKNGGKPFIVEPYDSQITYSRPWESISGALAIALDRGNLIKLEGVFEDARYSWAEASIEQYLDHQDDANTIDSSQKIIRLLRVHKYSVLTEFGHTRHQVPSRVRATNQDILDQFPRLFPPNYVRYRENDPAAKLLEKIKALKR